MSFNRVMGCRARPARWASCATRAAAAVTCCSVWLLQGYLAHKKLGDLLYRGTSHIRNRHPVESYSRNMRRALWWSYVGGRFLGSVVVTGVWWLQGYNADEKLQPP